MIELRPPARDDAAVQLHGYELTGYTGELDTDLLGKAPGRGARSAEHVRAEVQPVRVTRFRMHTAADTLRGLEHDDVAVAQVPRGRKASDACSHHHDVSDALSDVRKRIHSEPPGGVERLEPAGGPIVQRIDDPADDHHR
jgi:hypothetical protein